MATTDDTPASLRAERAARRAAHPSARHMLESDLLDRALALAEKRERELEARDLAWSDALDFTPCTPAEAGEHLKGLLKPLVQMYEVCGLSPLKYPNGRRLPDADLCQDAAYLAFVLGGLESDLTTARRERDEARAEVERLERQYEEVHAHREGLHQCLDEIVHLLDVRIGSSIIEAVEKVIADRDSLRTQLDEARAEVERLRSERQILPVRPDTLAQREAKLGSHIAELEAEADKMDLETARAHYVCAMANWTAALDLRDEVKADNVTLRARLERAEADSAREGRRGHHE